jgi:uncharacterized protein (DUF1015 family)
VHVPRFDPFPALRYATDQLDDVIAPPYDVLSAADLDELEQRHEHNVVRVDVPRETEGAQRYERAATTLREWVESGVLVRDDEPSFTIYRMRFVDEAGTAREIVGVLGALEVVDEGAGGVLPHERTTPKASTDRLDLTRATRANLSPVWGLSLAPGLTDLLRAPGEPMGSVSVDGVEHMVERVTDPARLAAIGTNLASDDVLIADGHHRYGVARTYRDEERSAGRGGGSAETTLTFVNELVADQLSVAAIHRLYRGLSHDALRDALRTCFLTEPGGPVGQGTLGEMEARGALCLVAPDGSGTWLTPRPGAFDRLRSLDGLWLEHALTDVAVDVAYQHGVEHVLAALRGGDAEAAVLIRPVSVDEIVRTAREGLLMPPKSTFFTPKLRTGLVIRPL